MTTSPSNGLARKWGPWSVWKNEIILGSYLPLFTRAGSGSLYRTFIDGFAGSALNVERHTGREVRSSPEIALSVDPQFTHVMLFELPKNATSLEQKLRAQYPGREIKVFGGDCNERLQEGFDWWKQQGTAPNRHPHLGQTLAYFDPNNNLDLKWSTVRNVAKFDTERVAPGQMIRQRPIELLILFPIWGLRNRLFVKPGTARVADENAEVVSGLFGCDDWLDIYNDQRQGVFSDGDAAWRWYVELYRRQLQQLGYQHVMAIETRNTKNVMQYHLVFASANDAGGQLMRAVMSNARTILPKKLSEERERKRNSPGQDRLPGLERELEEMQVAPEQCVSMMSHDPLSYEAGSGLMVPIDPVITSRRRRTKVSEGQLAFDI